MIAHLNGDFETVDFVGNRSVLLYDNIEFEEYPLHWHNAVEIIMPLVNDFKVHCCGKDYVLGERDMLIIPAGELHKLEANKGRRMIFICDNNAIATNPALSDLQPLLSEPILINSEEYDKDFIVSINQLMKDIYVLYSDFKDMAEIYIYMKFLTILVRIKEYRKNKINYDDSLFNDKFNLIIKYIDQNYMYDISLDNLAKVAGYSKYHFSRVFKKYSSTSFIDLVNKRRIRAAEQLLLEGDLLVTDIAMQSGFSSLTTFNRVFKEMKGCTPSEFKKLYVVSDTSEKLSKAASV